MIPRILLLLLCAGGVCAYAEKNPAAVRVDVGNRVIRSFDPKTSFGAGLDGHGEGDSAKMLSPASVRKMLKAGLGPVSVRLRTELAVEAWHWNPRGNWSDPKHSQGYWTSDATPDPAHPILTSYGYKLPRRGDTLDEANDDGYSRLVDGDRSSFWKSNPYLTHAYTHEPDSHHPQWVVLDFGKPVPINAISILWGEPYATRFRIEYATRGRVYFGGHPWNYFAPVWRDFPRGDVRQGKGGEQFLKFGRTIHARYLRIWMTESSGTAPAGSKDPRDAMGFAIREVMVGEAGQFDFDDHVIHSQDKKQTLCYVSSTDPWHRTCDRDPRTEQPGLDRIADCGVTRGLPMMLAIPVLYDTPENGAALATYARRQGISVSRLELGEEPDGQRVDPRDFGALYAQTARLIRKADPKVVMGGPSFVTLDADHADDQTYRFDKRWWIRDFRRELDRQGEGGSFRFLSFEWYPFDDVQEGESRQLPRSSAMLARVLHRYGSLGLPLVIGEYNYSVFPCRQEVDLAGGLLNAEIAAQFLCLGGFAAYYYGYEPNKLENTCGSWGNQLMLLNREGGLSPVATFHTLCLLNREWMDPRGGSHGVLPVSLHGDAGLLEAWALCRPDHSRSLLLINKSDHPVSVAVHGMESSMVSIYDSWQYRWLEDGRSGHPVKNLPPVNSPCVGDSVTLPAFTLAVIR
jgi:F5/8 type C domain